MHESLVCQALNIFISTLFNMKNYYLLISKPLSDTDTSHFCEESSLAELKFWENSCPSHG